MPDHLDVVAAARDYLAARSELGPPDAVERAVTARLDLDPHYCRLVADHFDRVVPEAAGPGLSGRYEQFVRECRMQYDAVRELGIEVRPWRGAGPPYPDSAAMFRQITAEGVLYVHLTEAGHGPPGDVGRHPLRGESDVVADGIRLRHNDLFRVAHDVFGHLAGRNGFGPAGELRAAYCHLPLFPAEVHPVLFAEHVAQTCWFYFGSHLRDGSGHVPGRDEPGYRPPRTRPYPPQKVFAVAGEHIDWFRRMFTDREYA